MDPQATIGKLRAAFVNHKPAVLLSGAGVVAVLGYRHHQTAGGAGVLDPAAADAADGATIAGYNPAGATGAAGYDSSGNDVYNALQPQIEQTQSMLEALLERLGVPAKAPTKKKPPPKKRPPKKRPPKKKPPKKKRHPGRGHKKRHHHHHPTKRPAPHHAPPHMMGPFHLPPKTPHKSGHKTPPKGWVATRRGATLSTAHRAGHSPAPTTRRA